MTSPWTIPDAVTALLLAVAFLVAVHTWPVGTRRAHRSPVVGALLLTAALVISLAARPLPDTATLVGAAAVLLGAVAVAAVRTARSASATPGPAHNPSPSLDESAVLIGWIDGHWRTHLVCAAASLDLAGRLHDGPLTTAELAAVTGSPAPVLGRLLSGLQLLGVVARSGDRWTSTERGAALERDAPGGAHHRALVTSAVFLPLWGRLPAIAHGAPVGPPGSGELFGRLFDGAGTAAAFDRLMVAQTRAVVAALSEHCCLAGSGTLVDVGGGTGGLLTGVLAGRPRWRGVVLERPDVAERARRHLAGTDASGRFSAVDGDFFESVPGCGDVYVLSFVLHDWDDPDAERILGTCRRHMPPHARLLVVEQLLDDTGPGPDRARYYDLHMLAVTGGRERTLPEFRALLHRTGFTVLAPLPAGHGRWIIEARPAR